MAGRNWPRIGYIRSPIADDTLAALRSYPEAVDLLAALSKADLDEAYVCELARSLALRHPRVRAVAMDIGMTTDGNKEKWEVNRNDAADRGTWMHLQFELWLNRCPVDESTPEMQLFIPCVRSLRVAYRTEWAIYGDDERLAGSIDFAGQDEQGGPCSL